MFNYPFFSQLRYFYNDVCKAPRYTPKFKNKSKLSWSFRSRVTIGTVAHSARLFFCLDQTPTSLVEQAQSTPQHSTTSSTLAICFTSGQKSRRLQSSLPNLTNASRRRATAIRYLRYATSTNTSISINPNLNPTSANNNLYTRAQALQLYSCLFFI